MSDPFNLPPETVTTGQLFMLLQSMNARLATMASEQARQAQQIDKQTADTADMLSAWKAGGTVLRFVKLIGGVAVAVTAAWGLFITLVRGGST